MSAASASPHLLVPSEAETFLSPEEAKANLKACDVAMEVSRFFEEERRWLMRRKGEIVGEIEAEVSRLCGEIRAQAEVAKQAAETEADRAISRLETFRGIEQRDFVFSVKSSSRHLVALKLEIKKLSFQDLFNITSISAHKKIYKNLDGSRGWGFDGRKIDALTIQVSKKIYLSGVMLGQPLPQQKATEVKSLQIRNGPSTQSSIIYEHQENTVLDPNDPAPIIRFVRPIELLVNQEYTLKALIAGGSMSAGNTVSNRLQEGLEVQLFDTKFEGGETTNSTGPISGVFFGFEYTS